MYLYDDIYNDTYDLIQESKSVQRYKSRLWNHPDCRDPDHPGCVDCESIEEADTEEAEE